MSSSGFTESVVEEAALDWLRGLGYAVLHGPEVAPGEPLAERDGYGEVVLRRRLREAIARLNPRMPAAARDEASRKLTRREHPDLVLDNRAFHRRLVDGVEGEYRAADGRVVGDRARLVDFDDVGANDWLVVNQFTVAEGRQTRRPDVVVFVNGLPLAVFELKNAAAEDATIWTAYNQLQTYKLRIPDLFACNEVLVISDGVEARVGSLTASKERFAPWRTIEGEDDAPAHLPALRVVIEGLFERRRFLDYLRSFIVFEQDGARVEKKIAAYHQFHAVARAVEETIAASSLGGDRRAGVIWHTQGSGKSLTMAFYAGRVVLHPAMENPTLVVLTDRNDLDEQLFGTFAGCSDLLRQDPSKAKDRDDLRDLLRVASGGVIFTTVQKFMPREKGERYPLLSDRRNVVVIADEAHRSQYDFVDGFARHLRDALPNASFIGFTGTPIEQSDRSTLAVFGDYISVYDIERAVRDGATVPIYYEGRLVRLDLDPSQRPLLDAAFDEVTEGEEAQQRDRLRSKWAALEAIVGTERRLSLVAADLVEHVERRLEAIEGKAMVVCMSRRICVDLYDQIVALRPDWHDPDDDAGAIKVVMTGSASDPLAWQGHIRPKAGRTRLAARLRDPDDPLHLVIVRDMWLTGFDAPPLHTMYVDKPMRGHGLMQAIARVNRVFRDKPGGLVVDYLGLADQLRAALATYTQGGGHGRATIDQADAVAVMLEKHEIVAALFHGFDYGAFIAGTPTERVSVLPAAQEHIVAQRDGKERLLRHVTELSKAFALAVPHQEALAIRDDLAFFQAIRAQVAKTTGASERDADDLDRAVRQILSGAIMAGEVVDIFAAAGLSTPDLSILSDEFLAEVRDLPQKNLAVELLRKLLHDEVRLRERTNLVQARSFADMIDRSLRRYHTRAIETAQVIEELIQLARDIKAAQQRGEQLGLSDDEIAFYDALEANDTAVRVLGDDTLKQIARDLVDTVKRNTGIDWTVRENVRARLRVLVRRILRKHGYPPDKQEQAVTTVLQQAELFAGTWAA